MVNGPKESFRDLKMKTRRSDSVTTFDELAAEYDAWFEEEGKVIFATEVQALQEVLPSLPEPWLEVGVGSGRFAQALGDKVWNRSIRKSPGYGEKAWGNHVSIQRGTDTIWGRSVRHCVSDSYAVLR